MGKPVYVFESITHFSIENIEKVDPRIDCITKLTLKIGSNIRPGELSLVLIKPFPPFAREGASLTTLKSLHAEDIESIWAFPALTNEGQAHIEIVMKSDQRSAFDCQEIEGLPDRVDTVQ